MRLLENDRWRGEFLLEKNGRYRYTVEAWPDTFESWRHDLKKRLDAEQPVTLELKEGRELVVLATEQAQGADRKQLVQALARFDQLGDDADRIDLLLTPTLRRLMARHTDRRLASVYEKELEVVVDRVRARYAAWYEMFPRSQGTVPGKSATFKDCERRLPEIRAMGFDVVYLVPIHPIGRVNRKGPNNAADAGPDDPGSPYAIGSAEGGHKAVHPELGTLEDFEHFAARCRELDMEVALDFAIQCAPDHPYVQEHPDWFKWRPDGTIRYAENPPKKYQDIVPVQFYGPHQEELWREWRDVVLFWAERGVRTFRVDNPHTKPIPFWEWLIREVQDRHPDVVFLSEAFTRPKLVKALAMAGFSQSYTYFTWRNFKHELTDYLAELARSECREYLRPNFFTNTPDILPQYLQTGGRPAFMVRLVLAATLSSVYGIYNGFELCEAGAIPGTEEYLNSEKYQYKVWDWGRPGHIKDWITTVNRIRRENPALHEFENLGFHAADDDNVLFYGKATLDGANRVFVAVNLDPFEPHQAVLEFPLEEMGIRPNQTFQVEELITGRKHLWRGRRHSVDLDPQANPAEIYRVSGWAHRDYVDSCY
jgi:starch synthase (maltosyl-transferring)